MKIQNSVTETTLVAEFQNVLPFPSYPCCRFLDQNTAEFVASLLPSLHLQNTRGSSKEKRVTTVIVQESKLMSI